MYIAWLSNTTFIAHRQRKTTYITNIFKHTNIKIAYCTNNFGQQNLTSKTHNHDKFSATGVYKSTCPECGKAYTGQTRRNFSKSYNKHRHAYRNNCHFSKFAQLLNEHTHTFEPIENIMQILSYQKKGPHFNTTEWVYIHKENANDNQLNNKQKSLDAILNIRM